MYDDVRTFGQILQTADETIKLPKNILSEGQYIWSFASCFTKGRLVLQHCSL